MIKALEGGRGLAALIVALYHLRIGADYFSVIRNGYLFVDLFFVLSGFVICASYWQKLGTAGDFRSFMIRRFGRLFPLLIFSTAFFVLTANAIIFAKRLLFANGYASILNNPGALEYSIPGTAEIFSTLTFTHGMGVFDDLILNTPSWSISTEFYTYLLFAMLCLLLDGRIRLVAFCILSVIGFLVSVGASVNVHRCLSQGGCLSLTYDFGFARTIYSFFLGALAFHASRVMQFNPNLLQLAGMAALLALFSLVDAFPAVAFALPVTFAILILSVHSDKGWLADIFSTGPFQVLGQRSYSIYLMHMPLILFFENIAKRVDGAFSSTIVLLVFVAVLVLVSGWTYKFVEDPFRAMFNRIATGVGAYRAGPAN